MLSSHESKHLAYSFRYTSERQCLHLYFDNIIKLDSINQIYTLTRDDLHVTFLFIKYNC